MQRLVLMCLFIKLRERLSKSMGINMSDYFWFGSVFIKKKITKPVFLKKTGTGSNRPISVILEQKLVQTSFARFFPV